jgi:hypothetical protein
MQAPYSFLAKMTAVSAGTPKTNKKIGSSAIKEYPA